MIALFGAAGSGKSLQGEIIAGKYGWKWLSVGELLRDQNDPEIAKVQQTGALVDDKLVTRLMHDAILELEKTGAEVILDGYPRNEGQAKLMAENGDMKKVEGAIVLEVARDELWQRMEGRKRADDTRESAEKRWEIFEQNIYSILPLFEANNVKVTTLDGLGTIDEITARIEAVLKEWGMISEVAHEAKEKDGPEKSYGE
jgi:adenylate kinase